MTIPIPAAAAGSPLDPTVLASATEQFPPGENAALKRLDSFVAQRIVNYKEDRDVLSLRDGTSALSPYLAAGIISTRTCLARAVAANNGRYDSGAAGMVKWIWELIWREFFRNIMVEYPRVCKYKPFKLQTDAVPWSYDERLFKAWCEGRTGYPIVDAGMRQLNTTGWMHNRLRMITASFLTKDLGIDWRMGEKYFMQNLIDGDLASKLSVWGGEVLLLL